MSQYKKVVAFTLKAANAQKRIREVSKVSDAVIITDHAMTRLDQRGLTTRDLFNILRNGFVDEDPIEVKGGEWKCKVTRTMPGGRTAGAITVILQNGMLVVVTVEWEDGR